MTLEVAGEERLIALHSDLGVAANAEIAVRARGGLEKGRVHGVEDRAHLGV